MGGKRGGVGSRWCSNDFSGVKMEKKITNHKQSLWQMLKLMPYNGFVHKFKFKANTIDSWKGVENLVTIGFRPAGYTVAIYAARANLVHTKQGPVLDSLGLPLAVVEGIDRPQNENLNGQNLPLDVRKLPPKGVYPNGAIRARKPRIFEQFRIKQNPQYSSSLRHQRAWGSETTPCNPLLALPAGGRYSTLTL
ncbi:hypothetical protein Tco_0533033 [Tanacetum coccineum]